ncbi:MAG: hypothetical protein NTX50_29680 [Candidatus Sumerlaeota bacterium]|nr:hypothetical protein [Candidatus Sumerlaeota bacterium]
MPLPDYYSIVFQNCDDMKDVSDPLARRALEHKMKEIASVITNGKQSIPDFIGLAEVSKALLPEFCDCLIPNEYNWEWAGAEQDNSPGLAILYRTNTASIVRCSRDRNLRSKNQRSYWAAAEFALQTQAPHPEGVHFWLIINHWPSKLYDEGEGKESIAKEISALAAGCEYLLIRKGSDEVSLDQSFPLWENDANVILVGDFNCEPWESPLHLNAKGTFKTYYDPEMPYESKKLPYFYNPILKAADVYGTFPTSGESPLYFLDQALFSPQFLKNSVLRYLNGSFVTKRQEPKNSDHYMICFKIQAF